VRWKALLGHEKSTWSAAGRRNPDEAQGGSRAVQIWARSLASRPVDFTSRRGAATCQTLAFSKARSARQRMSLSGGDGDWR
jgi:hypothetical protein